jgi:predicted transcriptional regulator
MDGMDGMETKMHEVSVGVPRQLWDRVESAAQDDSTTGSAMVAEALARYLSLRARLRTVEAWAGQGGAADFDELAEADLNLDSTGCA